MKWISVIAVFILLISCSVNPEPLVAGRDQCYTCKMPVADTRYGAEVVTRKGKIFKFDDIICMVQYLNSGLIEQKDISSALVANYQNGKELIDASGACFLISEQLKTPMNSQAVAFTDCKSAESFLNTFTGKLVSWDELSQGLK